jgi:hypothetical protein
MKLRNLSLSIALTFAVAMPVMSADGPAEMPKTPEAWAAQMWDFTRNPNVLKDPKQFVPFMSAALEPSFYTGMGMQMLDPSMWAYSLNSMMNPAAYSAWMPLLTDPNVYMKWLAAGFDPNFYTALLTQFTDPGKMMRWLMAPVDPKLWGLMMQSLNPGMYLKWLMSPLDPRWLQAGVNTINPNIYLGWLGSMMNPASYGDLWKGFLAPVVPTTGVPASPASPWGTTGYGAPSFNYADPNAWAQMFQVPGAPAPMAAPGAAPAATQPQAIFNPFDPNAWTQIWQQQQPAPAAAPQK